MGDEADYRTLANEAGLTVTCVEDLSEQVRRTWALCARRLGYKLATQPRYARYLLDPRTANRVFALTLFVCCSPTGPAPCATA